MVHEIEKANESHLQGVVLCSVVKKQPKYDCYTDSQFQIH